MTGAAPPPRADGSLVRLFVGASLFIGGIGVGIFGFFNLAGVLEQGGYGTPAVRNALVILGLAGGCLAAGIATVIWDLSKRFER